MSTEDRPEDPPPEAAPSAEEPVEPPQEIGVEAADPDASEPPADATPPPNDAPPIDDDWAPAAEELDDSPPPPPEPPRRSFPENGGELIARRAREVDVRPEAPADLDAERAVLACGLFKEKLFVLVIGKVQPEDFFDPRHGAIFTAMVSLLSTAAPITPLTVKSELDRLNLHDRGVTLKQLFDLTTHAGSTLAVQYHAERVGKLGHVRRILGGLHKAQAFGYQRGLDPDAFVEAVQNEVVAELENLTGGGELEHIAAIVPGVHDRILERHEQHKAGKRVTGISTGYRDIDKLLMGWHPSDLVILAARPAMGKTALALNMAYKVAQARHPVVVFSMEMGREQLVQRMVADVANVTLNQVRSGDIADDDKIALSDASGLLSTLHLYIDDTPGLTAMDVRARAKRVQMQHGSIGLIVVDYLQLMRGSGGSRQSREQAIAEISRSLKGLAKELKTTVLALSQLNRGVESRTPPIPQLADLRESGSIEQDADIVAFLYREYYYRQKRNEDDPGDPNGALFLVAKHRAGETDNVKLFFDGRYTRFRTDDRWKSDPGPQSGGYG